MHCAKPATLPCLLNDMVKLNIQCMLSQISCYPCGAIILRTILVPRGRTPFGQHQESRPLANTAAKRMRMRHLRLFPVCGVGYSLLLALRCFKACCCESEPQMKEKRTTNTKRYVDNNLLQLLVLEMGLLEIIFGPRSGRHYLLVQLLIYSRFFQFVDRTTTKLNL